MQVTFINQATIGYEAANFTIDYGKIIPDHPEILQNLISNTIYEYSDVKANFQHFFLNKKDVFGFDCKLQYSIARFDGLISQYKTLLFFPELENEMHIDVKQVDYCVLELSKSFKLASTIVSLTLSRIIPIQVQKRGISTGNSITTSAPNTSDSNNFSGGTTLTVNTRLYF